MGDRNRGVYHKFNVERTDGKSEPGQKHHGCFYFVLDCDHDPHARAALQAYEKSCRATYPSLADDINNILMDRDFGQLDANRSAQETRESPEAQQQRNSEWDRQREQIAASTWRCTVCNNVNPDDATHCRQCEYSRMVTREGRLVPRDGQR